VDTNSTCRVEPCKVYNLGATYLSTDLVFHARTKHIEVDYHFLRERFAQKQLVMCFMLANDQLVDGFTKALPMAKLKQIQYNLNLGGLPKKGGC
jgi:hypothetical protein